MRCRNKLIVIVINVTFDLVRLVMLQGQTKKFTVGEVEQSTNVLTKSAEGDRGAGTWE